jgi:site-specific DNA recombinase
MATPRKSDLPWFAYIRVSSKDQGDKYGPARQVEAIRNWLAVNVPEARVPGLDTCVISPREVRPSEYVGFDKQTGKNDDRPDFQRGWQLARDGKIGGVISLRLDRVARNAEDAYILRSRMKRMSVRLEFATQTFDHTPTGDLMYQVYASFAELEGKLILERTAEGRKGRVLQDKLFASPRGVPYGYTYVDEAVAKKHPSAVLGKAIINPAEAKIVRLIFRLYVQEGQSAYEIMVYLNRKKILTQRGFAWWRESVMQVLKKADQYAGVHIVRLGIVAAQREYAERVKLMGDNATPIDLSGVEEGKLDLPPIIDAEMARLANATRTQNKVKKAGRPSTQFPLSKLVYCAAQNADGPCGGMWYFRMRGTGRTGVGYCYKHNYNSGGEVHMRCLSSEMSSDKLEGIVIDAMKNHLRRPEVAHATALQAYRAEHGSDASQRREEAEADLRSLREQQKHFGTILLNASLTKLHGTANSRFADLEMKIQELEQKLRRAPITQMFSEGALVAAFERKLEVLDKIKTFEDKREFLQSTVERIDITQEEVVIQGSIALPDQAKLEGRAGPRFQFYPAIPFVITCSIPASYPPDKRTKAALKSWATRRAKERVA